MLTISFLFKVFKMVTYNTSSTFTISLWFVSLHFPIPANGVHFSCVIFHFYCLLLSPSYLNPSLVLSVFWIFKGFARKPVFGSLLPSIDLNLFASSSNTSFILLFSSIFTHSPTPSHTQVLLTLLFFYENQWPLGHNKKMDRQQLSSPHLHLGDHLLPKGVQALKLSEMEY